MGYDSPNALLRREHFAGEAGGGATTEYCKFRSFQKAKLKAVHFVVTTAGTATAHKLDIFHGTTSIGSTTLGTNTAGYSASNTDVDQSLAALDQISVKTGADATGKAHVVFEYAVDHDASQST